MLTIAFLRKVTINFGMLGSLMKNWIVGYSNYHL